MDNGEKEKVLKTCGFANSNVGLFIYGLKEENGQHNAVAGVSIKAKRWDGKITIPDCIKESIELA